MDDCEPDVITLLVKEDIKRLEILTRSKTRLSDWNAMQGRLRLVREDVYRA